ncbi:hypothetical protein [Streptomyces sp. NPDC056291]|uniref:hypothetical protein n=1 Tax=Streptomyces sp. NPDC056291 TaxID=3345772 RepID=UPI0035D55C4B
MSDNDPEQSSPVGPVQPEPASAATEPAVNVPAAPAAPAPRPKRQGRPDRTATVAVSALLALAAVTGIGCTAVTVSGADRDAGAPVWALPEKAGQNGQGGKKATASGLGGLLVPYGNGWGRGPDIAEFGSDAVFTGRQVAELRKESLRDLPRSRRERLEREIDRQRVTGMVMRSYLSTDDIAYMYAKDAFTVSVVLTRMENRAAVSNTARFQNELADAFRVFRKGPSIKGHKDARCFLPPKDAEEDLETMFCFAHVGDVLVTVAAEGAKPLDTKQAASLLTKQLDRITEPGEAV